MNTTVRWKPNVTVAAVIEREGRFHGRGAADMKGFIAACLSAVPAWQRGRLQRPIHLAFSYDEEIGCLGVPRLVDSLEGAQQIARIDLQSLYLQHMRA